MNPKRPSSTVLTWMCLAVCGAMAAAGLWPFNFQPVNHAALDPAPAGLRFEAPAERSKRDLGGIVFTPEPLKPSPQADARPGEVSLDIALRAAEESGSCLRRILDVRRPDGGEAFFIGQWKSYVIVRAVAPQGSGAPYRDAGLGHVLIAGRTIRVTIVSSAGGTTLFVDGQPARYFEMSLLPEGGSLEGHTLYFGNSPDLQCPWSGDIYRCAVFGRALAPADAAALERTQANGSSACADAVACYRFDDPAGMQLQDRSAAQNHLHLAERLFFAKPFLRGVDRQSFSFSDIVLNLLGFMPFGFLMTLRLRMAGVLSEDHCGWVAVVLGLTVSLAIETLQVFLPGRDSSLLDLAANTIGTAMGAGILTVLANGRRERQLRFSTLSL